MKTKPLGRVFVASQDDLLTIGATRGDALQSLAEQIFERARVKRAHTKQVNENEKATT